jgi:tRNA(fMet)-specific endonuclease VapC
MTYLLDANACIHLINGTAPALMARFREESPVSLRMSSVVRAELVFGARNSSRAAENLRLIEAFWEPFVSLPFDDLGAEQYGLIRAELKRQGRPIGANDLLIAATALAFDVTLVTHNTREFGRVPGLKLEDWEA